MESFDPKQPTTGTAGRIMLFLSWIMAVALFAFLAQDWLEHAYNPNQLSSNSIETGNSSKVSLKRNRYGHYVSSGKINGQATTFLLDTGATDVVIPESMARHLGLKAGAPYQSMTANGVITVFSTYLDTIELGAIRLYNIRGAINPSMEGNEILLGMSFLKHLSFNQQGDELILETATGIKNQWKQ